MENTTNYNLQKYQSGDYFNPLTVGNPNLDRIDATMKLNSDRSIGRATELGSQGVHAITLTDVDCKTFKFIATGNYSAGETFTVNGIQVNAYTPSGSALVSNAFVTGSVVIASLNEDGNAITVYVSGTSTADNSLRLGGELPTYYAKQSDMTQAESDITNLQNQNGNTSIVGIGDGTTTGAISKVNSMLIDAFTTAKQSFSGSGTVEKTVTIDEDKLINITLFSTTRGTPYILLKIIINDEVMVESANYGSTYPDNNNGNCTLLKKVNAGDVIKISGYSASGTTTYNVVSNLTFN